MNIESTKSIPITPITDQFTLYDEKVNSDLSSNLPFIGFVKNIGQVDNEEIYFYISFNSICVGFGTSKINLLTKEDNFTITFPNSQNIIPIGTNIKSNTINYFYGDNQFTNIPTCNELWYYNIYPEIDLKFYMSEKGLKYDFIVHPHSNPNIISVEVNEKLSLCIREQLITVQSDSLPEKFLFQDGCLDVFQEDGKKIIAQYVPNENDPNSYRFKINSYDQAQTLIIDPLILFFSTYLGGSSYEIGCDIAVDLEGNSYVTGFTNSLDWPTLNAYQHTHGGDKYDAFITKLNSTGNGLIFSTFIGGDNNDYGRAIDVDIDGNSYLTGETASTNFPKKNPYQNELHGDSDAFLLKLNATGDGLIFSTYIGGSREESAKGIDVDTNGNSFIVGNTRSDDYPTKNPFQSSHHGAWPSGDVFIAKFNSLGYLMFSTYFGGTNNEGGSAITVDLEGNTYFTGTTSSDDLPIMNAFKNTHVGWDMDAFVVKLNATGNGLIFSTYLGGTDHDSGLDIAIDPYGNSYITGETSSSDFPTLNGYQNIYPGQNNAYVTKLNATGNGLIFSTYLGGGQGNGITVDSFFNVYITGRTASEDFPVKNAYQSIKNEMLDVFITKLNRTGNGIIFSTYLGGHGSEYPRAIVVENTGKVYIVGVTLSPDFPLSNEFDSTLGGSTDLFISVLQSEIQITLDINPDTLNLKSNGEWITAYIELPEGYDVNNININSIKLIIDTHMFIIDPLAPLYIGDYDSDYIPDLMVKFNRLSITSVLNVDDCESDSGEEYLVNFKITGICDSVNFEGSDWVRVIKPGK